MIGIDVRHKKACTTRREDGRCCDATYQAHVFDARTGKRLRKTFANRTAAKIWRQDAIVAIRNGEAAKLAPASRTVDEALDALLDGMKGSTVLDRSGRRYRPATIRSYSEAAERYLKPALGRLRLSEVQRRDVQRLIDRMHADGLKGSTIRNKLDPLRVLYRRAMQDDEIDRSPVTNLRLPAMKTKARTVVAPEQAAILLAALPDSERALWTVAFYAGLRIGELRALRWLNV